METLETPFLSNYVVFLLHIIAPLPYAIQLTVMSNIASISWNTTWDEYVIEEYSMADDLVRHWTTDNRLMSSFNLSSATSEKVKLSICPDVHINFTIGNIQVSVLIVSYFVIV